MDRAAAERALQELAEQAESTDPRRVAQAERAADDLVSLVEPVSGPKELGEEKDRHHHRMLTFPLVDSKPAQANALLFAHDTGIISFLRSVAAEPVSLFGGPLGFIAHRLFFFRSFCLCSLFSWRASLTRARTSC